MKKSLIAFAFVSILFAGVSAFAQSDADVKIKVNLDS